MKNGRALTALLLLLFACAACANRAAIATRELQANGSGVALHVRVAGDPDSGNVLIAVHGGPGMTSDYMLDLEGLAGPDLAVVTYDQRGVGRSAGPQADPANYTLARYAEDLDAVREAVGVERVHVFGHSWGGVVAQQYVVLYPERVRSLVLMGSGPPTWEQTEQCQQALVRRIAVLIGQGIIPENPQGAGDYLSAYFSDPDFQFPEAGPARAPQLDERTLQVSDLTWAANSGYDLTADLAGLRLHVLNLWGEDDPVRGIAGPAISAALPAADVQTVALAGCGHFWQECPQPFFTAVRTFLRLEEAAP